ncbi:hypothetical protein KGF54_005075 [Candida jiufengensis]|uniref:uncharacterized protein n=1 Tax=Candida jiufengensis TaxID=497108 RepID=UPI002223F1C3|nr:uncharacterized protein KGF54_005075 [Candida jiufengensis]KAI5952000.1 hypothetical protein KGF54_005075 [Candida jiufengensis]
MSDDSSYILNSSSVNESTINLNDDLPIGSEHSSNIIEQSPSFNHNNNYNNNNNNNHLRVHRRTESTNSFIKNRRSIDNESYVSSGTLFTFDENRNDTAYSPLGPNSIYELTIGSDTARARRNRIPKTSVTLNGGTTTIYNINTPTSKDIPQIQLEKLNLKVSNQELEAKFVNDIAKEYKKFEDSHKKLTEDSLRKLSQPSAQGELSTSSSIENFQNIEPLLNEVPDIFLDPDFKLDDPRTFKKVLENSNLKYEQDHIINDTDLQEKFSHYLDLVEMNLIAEIEKSSDSFFDTIGDIENIQKKSDNCVNDYQNIIKKLNHLEQNQAKQGLRILDKMIEKRNVEALEITTIQLQYITSIFQLANLSFHHNDYFKCLNQIVAVESLIHGVHYDEIIDEDVKNLYPKLTVINLSNLPALIHLINDLQTLKTNCSRKYIHDFIDLLLQDLSSHYKSVPTKDTLNRMYVNKDKSRKYASKPINTSFRNLDPTFQSKLQEYVSNLIKAGNLINAYTLYQNRFIGEIKEIIKSNIPTTQKIDDLDSETSPTPPDSATTTTTITSNALGTNIKVLTPKEFEAMLSKTYAQLSECLRRLTVHQKLLLDIALKTIPPTSNINIMSLDITKAIHKAIELTQIRLRKVISVRSEQTADLPIQLYLRLFSITSAYLQECELINPAFESSGAVGDLKAWFQDHTVYFIHRIHVNSSKSMALSCSRETWKIMDDPEILGPVQVSLNEIIEYSEYQKTNGSRGFSGSDWLNSNDFYQDDKDIVDEQPQITTNKLIIDDNEFIIPNLAVITVNHIKNYIIASKAFPNYSTTIENNLLNYFKELNSKTSQAVLGAGATRTAGLKHITTKHLAICIRFIEFNISFLQNLQHIFKDERTEDQISFTKMISNYKDHETELFAKIITIMQERTIASCNKLPNINWSEPVKHPLHCHQYMENLVKDTSTVAKTLMKYLPELKYSLILSQIFDSYKRLFVESYCTKLPTFKDFNEKHNVLKDVDYFRVKLSEFPGYGNSGLVIWENVNSMPTVEDIEMEEKMRKNVNLEQKEVTTPVAAEVSAKSQNTFQKLVSSARSSFEKSNTPKAEEVEKVLNEVVGEPATENNVLFDSENIQETIADQKVEKDLPEIKNDQSEVIENGNKPKVGNIQNGSNESETSEAININNGHHSISADENKNGNPENEQDIKELPEETVAHESESNGAQIVDERDGIAQMVNKEESSIANEEVVNDKDETTNEEPKKLENNTKEREGETKDTEEKLKEDELESTESLEDEVSTKENEKDLQENVNEKQEVQEETKNDSEQDKESLNDIVEKQATTENQESYDNKDEPAVVEEDTDLAKDALMEEAQEEESQITKKDSKNETEKSDGDQTQEVNEKGEAESISKESETSLNDENEITSPSDITETTNNKNNNNNETSTSNKSKNQKKKNKKKNKKK